MKNSYLIRSLGPNLLQDHSLRNHPSPLFHSLVFWVAFLGLLSCIGYGVAHAQTKDSDPLVMKVYPDGTKVILRWSEVGKGVDNGEKYGGAPRIVAYDPAKDGIVPIGETSPKAGAATNTVAQGSGSVVTPEQPAKMDYSKVNPDNFDNYGPKEGFGFRTAVGVAFQQTTSGRSINDLGTGTDYTTITFQPGIRFDLEPYYNILDWFSVGVESAFIYNKIHSITTNGDAVYQGSPQFGNGSFYQVPILANVRFQLPTDGPVRAHWGGGFGGVWDYINVSTIHDSDGSPYSSTSYQWNYAFQLMAGLTYTVAPGFDLNASFKTLCIRHRPAEG